MRRITPKAAALACAALVPVVASSLSAQSLKGSTASVETMHSHAVRNDFTFYRTSTQVNAALKSGQLTRLSGNSNYELAAVAYPYVMDEARLFVERLSAQYRGACGEKLVVTGATRPTSMKLRNSSPNSVHPTGMAVDLRKPSGKCLKWLRSTLLELENTGVIEATEERSPPHFHVAVFPRQYGNYVVALESKATNLADTRLAIVAETAEPQILPYSVRNGDSLWKIATSHDTTVRELQELNRLRGSTIHPGQVILVPNAVTQKNQ